ncbi:MAG: hypothetical protein LBN34_07240 [Clostridiales Family XIII bacterium]|jgi:hypothetical protein|nr:hypothetical protein [Clostridiales Family XIII bacterium]
MTEPQTVLLVTFAVDSHLPFVTKQLDRLGQSWELLTTDLLGEKTNIIIEASGEKHTHVEYVVDSGKVVLPSQVGCVWNRRRIVSPMSPDTGTGDRLADQYIREQKIALLENGLSFIHSDWINSTYAQALAKPKVQQLNRALSYGLKIPATLCSCRPQEVQSFADSSPNGLITKVITPGTPLVDSFDKQYMIFTQNFNQEKISDEQILSAPAIYQEKITKKFEVRVVIVGENFFACKIDSQASEKTQLDWRHYDFDNVPHEPIIVPQKVRNALAEFVNSYGLVFATVDLAVTQDDEWVFFEINPNGQWAWLEELAGLPIGCAIATELSRLANGSNKN